MSTPSTQDDQVTQTALRDLYPWKRRCLNGAIVIHLAALLLMVGAGGSGNYSSPPLILRAAALTAPYVRFTGMQNGYRFFAPDPGPATVLWSRLTYEDGAVRWVETPGRESHPRSFAYQREFYPAMMLGMQTAAPGTPVVPGYPHLTDIGLTYASSYARHLAASWRKTGGDDMIHKVKTVELLVVTHAIRTPAQVRMGWAADDLRLYQPVSLGEFRADGSITGPTISLGHEKPAILELAERMFRDALSPTGDTAGPDLPAPLRTLLRFPELRSRDDSRPLQVRIGLAITSRDRSEQEGTR